MWELDPSSATLLETPWLNWKIGHCIVNWYVAAEINATVHVTYWSPTRFSHSEPHHLINSVSIEILASFLQCSEWQRNFTKFVPGFSSIATYHEFVSSSNSGAQPDSETPGRHNKLYNPKFTGAPKNPAKIYFKVTRGYINHGSSSPCRIEYPFGLYSSSFTNVMAAGRNHKISACARRTQDPSPALGGN